MKYLELYESFLGKQERPDDDFAKKLLNATKSEFDIENLSYSTNITPHYTYNLDDDIKYYLYTTQKIHLVDKNSLDWESLDVSTNIVKEFIKLFKSKKVKDKSEIIKVSKKEKIKSKFIERDPEIKLESFMEKDDEFVKQLIKELTDNFDLTHLRKEKGERRYNDNTIAWHIVQYYYTFNNNEICVQQMESGAVKRYYMWIGEIEFIVSKKLLRRLFTILDEGEKETLKKTLIPKEKDPDIEL
jgi:hypothetical protein